MLSEDINWVYFFVVIIPWLYSISNFFTRINISLLDKFIEGPADLQQDVTLINDPDPLGKLLAAIPAAVPVAVELRPNAEALPDFDHPSLHFELDPEYNDGVTHRIVIDPPIYVFGPEDGSLPGSVLKRCHRFIRIPSFQCLNLATSVATVLYDRMSKMPAVQWPAVKDRGVSAARGELATSSHY